MKADALAIKVRTQKVTDNNYEGLVFQFLDPESEEMRNMMAQAQPAQVQDAMEQLYADAIEMQMRERAALVGVALRRTSAEAVHAQPLPGGGHPPAGLHRGQLAGVTESA